MEYGWEFMCIVQKSKPEYYTIGTLPDFIYIDIGSVSLVS